MRALTFASALFFAAAPAPAGAQTTAARPKVAVIVVTLDQVRQVQAQHGRSALASLGGEEWGRFDLIDSTLPPELFRSCEEDRADGQLDYCIRFYLTRAELAADAPPTVVVAFDDRSPRARDRQGGEMRVTCYGRGVVPAEPEAQDTWLWPGSVRVHGVNDWTRDREALEACIKAAASEPWTGLRQPDPA